MKIIKFLHLNFQTERNVSLDAVLKQNSFVSYRYHMVIKSAKEVMLKNVNPKAGPGIWILKEKWQKPLMDIYDDILDEMEIFQNKIEIIKEKKSDKRLNEIRNIAKIAKEVNAKSVIVKGTQLQIEF